MFNPVAVLNSIIQCVFDFMNTEFSFGYYTFTFWQPVVFVVIGGAVFKAAQQLMDNE